MILYGYFIQAASVFQVCRQDATMTGKCGRIRQIQAAAACVFGERKSIRKECRTLTVTGMCGGCHPEGHSGRTEGRGWHVQGQRRH